MAPKKEKGKKGGVVTEESLQAVVLTDSYQTRFMPLAEETPRCLLPLANTPLIEYTLEFLATTGVDEVYVMCCAHADMIEEYIKDSRWGGHDAPFTIHIVPSPESQSVGDVMRDLDTKGVIKKDFLLISGDVVCNIDFRKVLEAHNARKQTDRNAIMTMVLRESTGLHRTRPRNSPGLFVLDDKTGRCLRYEAPGSNVADIALDAEVLAEHESVSFRNDLIDCQIDICTNDVPALFQENFDYEFIRSQFVKGILTSDLLGKTIYAHIISDKYAARVQSQQTYDAISKDIISRFAYPIAPDSNLLDDQTYSYQRGHIYKENEVVLAQSCHLESCCVIGQKTFIGEKTRISKSTVGRGCRIGNNVVLQGAYIWDNVVIEDNVTITDSIVASNAVIKSGAVIEPGAIISYGVTIGQGKTIPGTAKITTKKLQFDSDSESESDSDSSSRPRRSVGVKNLVNDVVGEDGYGYVYYDSDFASGESHASIPGLVYNMGHLNISDSSIVSTVQQRATAGHGRHRRTTSKGVIQLESESEEEEEEDESFISEAMATIERSITENHTVDVAMLELKTLRMTMNASPDDVRVALMGALVKHIINLINVDAMSPKAAARSVFTHWKQLIARQIFDLVDQVHLISALQRECAKRPQGGAIFLFSVEALYDEDVLDEDYIRQWYSSAESEESAKLKEIKSGFKVFMDFLNQESDEESDSDDDDDDE
ncbi:translation initiation factor eIF2B subunit epsilon [Trichomonascus vanleenenianus]|uniref:translation initiation factor eIF2B catalytic subunit epsilon n=1 Tax=Trichomonascus vanleenenianus TaxID=2268995 RepID=UPI003ECA37E1